MNELNVVPENTQHIDLNELPKPQKSIRTRKEDSDSRRKEFYQQLESVKGVDLGLQADEPEAPEQIEDKASYEDHDAPTIEDVADNAIADEYEDEEINSKVIPKKRFDKEIERRKQSEDKYLSEHEARIRAETQLELYNKALEEIQQKNQQHEPEFDPIDSDAHNVYMKEINALKSRLERQDANLTENERRQRFAQTVDYQAAEMAKKTPDFNEAYKYLINTEIQKGKMLGLSEQEAQGYALQQIQPIAWNAYDRGQNVAEVTYNLAKTYGYKSTSSGTKTNTTPNLDKIEKNMHKSQSIINEVKGVSTKLSPDTNRYISPEDFKQKMGGKNGRGTDIEQFYKQIEEYKKNPQRGYGN